MRVIDFVVCDDIRMEQGGKISLMGIYGEAIRLLLPEETTWPVPFRMGVFIRLQLDGEWQEGCRFVLEILLGDIQLGKFDGILDLRPQGDMLTLPLIAPLMQFPNSGILRLNFEVRNNRGDVLCSSSYPFPLPVSREPLSGNQATKNP